jgi:hypothetical protein
MPGLAPGIHVLFAALNPDRRGWPGRSPAMTRNAIEDIERFDRYVLLDFWLISAKHRSGWHVLAKKDG